MRMLLLASCLALPAVVQADPPTPQGAAEQRVATGERLTGSPSLVVGIEDSPEIAAALDVRASAEAPAAADAAADPAPTTEVIELEAPEVVVVNRTRHFRIIARTDAEPGPEPAAPSESGTSEQ